MKKTDNNKGVWEKGDIEVLKLVENGKTVKRTKRTSNKEKKNNK